MAIGSSPVGRTGGRWRRASNSRLSGSVALIVGLPLACLCADGLSAELRVPRTEAASTSLGGFDVKPGIPVAPISALSFYTATFIAEIVRAGILAVAQGPDRGRLFARPAAGADAAAGRHPAGDARHHPAADQPIPQPDQELVAGGRDRLSRPRRASSPAPCSTRPARRSRCIFITMLVYLSISLVTSLFMNWFNAKMALVER